MKIIRAILGSLILFFDWLFTPKGIRRDTAAQQAIDAETAKLTLYGYKSCPFCVKVKREIKRLSLDIEFRDAKRDPASREELTNGGGQLKVPCLRIETDSGENTQENTVQWMYESSDINAYLQQRFA
ncbi:MAG: glutathione S-transferase N-terminal domain-containing protein [Candidatus Pelagadaptatus aseana]|uniref:glutaredoxin family protein n=1 Tax=Candidatus Pelagadaptatus aseana TaxID=3120508 RepID=UPI0039B1DCCC